MPVHRRGEIREKICAWRDDPDNPLNHRINAEPIEYKIDPAIAADLEKFYIGKFEILLPTEHLENSVVEYMPVSFESDQKQIYVWPCYKNYSLATICVPESDEIPGYHEMQRRDCPFVSLLYDSQESEAVSQYKTDLWYLEAAYFITTWYWDEPWPEKVEEMARIGACAPEDIDDCITPWAVCDLETRLLLKNMLISDDGRMSRIKSANWDACYISQEFSDVVYMNLEGKTYCFFLDDERANTRVAQFSDKMQQTILASLKIHAEPDAGAIMYDKAREILDRDDLKLQEKLLGRFYALCAFSQEPTNLEYAQTYLSTFRDPSEQAQRAYEKVAVFLPDNEEIQRRADELDEWNWRNENYFQYEGDDPEVEYPVVNEDAKRTQTYYWDWKKLTDEEKKAKLQEAREREERASKKRKPNEQSAPSDEESGG